MKGAIFDMDGTLLDSMQVWVHVGFSVPLHSLVYSLPSS